MGSNSFSKNGGRAIDQTKKMILGINSVGESVPLTMMTEAQLQAQLAILQAEKAIAAQQAGTGS